MKPMPNDLINQIIKLTINLKINFVSKANQYILTNNDYNIITKIKGLLEELLEIDKRK